MCPVADLIRSRLADELSSPRDCLLPLSDWPVDTHTARVHAGLEQWYKTVKVGAERGIFIIVDEADILRKQHGGMVLNGAMAVD